VRTLCYSNRLDICSLRAGRQVGVASRDAPYLTIHVLRARADAVNVLRSIAKQNGRPELPGQVVVMLCMFVLCVKKQSLSLSLSLSRALSRSLACEEQRR
jgi:hypothetical protein